MPINLITVHMFAYEPNGVPPYNCALTSNGWNGPQYFLKDSLPDYNSQVSSNKIFHLFCRSTIFFFFCIDRLMTPKDVSIIVVSVVLYGGIKDTSVEASV